MAGKVITIKGSFTINIREDMREYSFRYPGRVFRREVGKKKKSEQGQKMARNGTGTNLIKDIRINLINHYVRMSESILLF